MKRFISFLTALAVCFSLLVPTIEAKHKHKSKHEDRVEKFYKHHHHHKKHHGHHKHLHHHHHHHHHHAPKVYYYEPARVVRVNHVETGLIPLVGFSLGPVINATVNMPVPVAHTRTVIIDRDYDDDYDDDDDYYWGRLGVYESTWPSSILTFDI